MNVQRSNLIIFIEMFQNHELEWSKENQLMVAFPSLFPIKVQESTLYIIKNSFTRDDEIFG